MGDYAQAKLSAENIILITWKEHKLWTEHPEKTKLLPEWQFVWEEYELLKIKYHEGYFNGK